MDRKIHKKIQDYPGGMGTLSLGMNISKNMLSSRFCKWTLNHDDDDDEG